MFGTGIFFNVPVGCGTIVGVEFVPPPSSMSALWRSVERFSGGSDISSSSSDVSLSSSSSSVSPSPAVFWQRSVTPTKKRCTLVLIA